MAKTAVVVLAEGFEEIEAVTPIDVLRRAGVEVTVAGLGDVEICGARGLVIDTDCRLSEVAFVPDAVVLPGGMPGSRNLGDSAEVRRLVLAVQAAGGLCAAICAAPALTFAKWGLLDGKTATCYPSLEKEFAPTTKFSTERVVVDGKLVTSRGPGTALAFALTLVELLASADAARRLRQDMLAG